MGSDIQLLTTTAHKLIMFTGAHTQPCGWHTSFIFHHVRPHMSTFRVYTVRADDDLQWGAPPLVAYPLFTYRAHLIVGRQ
jgi:hypothetical protein